MVNSLNPYMPCCYKCNQKFPMEGYMKIRVLKFLFFTLLLSVMMFAISCTVTQKESLDDSNQSDILDEEDGVESLPEHESDSVGGAHICELYMLRYDSTYHWFECECGVKKGKYTHDGGAATCTERAVCNTCEQEYGDYAMHNFTGFVEADNSFHWFECECGEVISDQHTYNLVEGVYQCGVCNFVSSKVASYTYNTYTTNLPSSWNPFSVVNSTDNQIIDYTQGNLFEFDFDFDEKGNIIPGGYNAEYSFATGLVDVSEKYGHPKCSGMAWEITIRHDGRWDDGTLITAYDFEYSMKELLNPLFGNYNADEFFSDTIELVNAREYVFQGLTLLVGAHTEFDTWEDAKINSNVKFDILSSATYFGAWASSRYAEYYDYAGEGTGWAWLICALGAETTPEDVLELQGKTWEEIESNDYLKATWDAVIGYYQTDPNEELHFFSLYYTYPTVDWADVGFKATSEYTFELHLSKPLNLLEEDGSLSYIAAYNMSRLPLVHKTKYEFCKFDNWGYWYTTYNTSVETSASWGPYMLTEYRNGEIYKLEKNPYWYGWNMALYDGQFQTTQIICTTVSDWDFAWSMFLAGEIDGIKVESSIFDYCKDLDRVYCEAGNTIYSIQLQSSYDYLKSRESYGVNKTILSYVEFRKALSLGIDRYEYARNNTGSSLVCLGLFGSPHYYDVSNGVLYRETDAAKLVLCKLYGVNPEDFNSLDEAVGSITGYDLAKARALIEEAYAKALENGDIDEDDVIVLTCGTNVDKASTRRFYDNLNAIWTELMKGTSLEGRFYMEFEEVGSGWVSLFRAGYYDVIAQAGWNGSEWDIGNLLRAYIDSVNHSYSASWDTTLERMQFTMHGVDANGVVTNNSEDSFVAEFDLMTWWTLLNTDWKSGVLDEEFRLDLIAALEYVVLEKYYSLPIENASKVSLMSYKCGYITNEYNTFMGFGGIRYLTYNYTDDEWVQWVEENAVDGKLNYR